MNPININKSTPSSQPATDHPGSNAIPPQANPIAPQAGSLGSQKKAEKKERSIQSASGQTPPRASEKNFKDSPARSKDEELMKIAKDSNTPYYERDRAIEALSTQEKRDEGWIAMATDPSLTAYNRIEAARKISADNIPTKDEVLLEIAKGIHTFDVYRIYAIKALSTQEKRDEGWIAMATDPSLDTYDRIEAAKNISADNTPTKDEILLEIAKGIHTFDVYRNRAIEALSTQEKRDEFWIARATDPSLTAYNRVDAARKISADNTPTKDEVLLEIAKDINTLFLTRDCAIEALSTQEKRDEFWIARATDPSLTADNRIEAAKNISADNTPTKDEVLLEIAKNVNTIYDNSSIEALSTQEKRDEVWIAIATDPSLDAYHRSRAAINLSDTETNTVLRNKILIQLYNEALNLGETLYLEGIVNAIQDPELQALAREALEAGGPVRLGSTKSARKG